MLAQKISTAAAAWRSPGWKSRNASAPTPATATAASAHGANYPPEDTAVRRKAAAQQTAASAGIRRAHCRAAASRCFMACPSFVPVIVNGESRGSCREMAKEFDFRTLVFSAAIW